MRITIDIPDELIERAIRTRDLRARRVAVAMVLEQVANKARREELVRRLGTFKIDMTLEHLRKLQGDDVTRAARADEFRARIGTFRLGMTREELLRWRRMGCGRERPEDEHGGETRADDS